MLQNSNVIAFTVFELLRENQQRRGKITTAPLPTQIRVKIFFTKRKPIRYYYFINIYIVYWNRVFMLMKFVIFNFSVTKLYIFLSISTYGLKFFIIFLIYNFPLFSLKKDFLGKWLFFINFYIYFQNLL